jgi:hypothetical protein
MAYPATSGPDFKSGFLDPCPVSNADIAQTLSECLHFYLDGRGATNTGRVNRRTTVLNGQECVQDDDRHYRYFDWAEFRTASEK